MTPTKHSSKGLLWTGRILSGLMTAFLLMDAVMHIAQPAAVVEAFARLGFPLRFAAGLGLIELACVLVYVYPRTAVLGAILLAGYLGGAVAMHLRVGSALFAEMLFPVYVGVLLWAGLYLREPRLSALLPWTRAAKSRESAPQAYARARVAQQ